MHGAPPHLCPSRSPPWPRCWESLLRFPLSPHLNSLWQSGCWTSGPGGSGIAVGSCTQCGRPRPAAPRPRPGGHPPHRPLQCPPGSTHLRGSPPGRAAGSTPGSTGTPCGPPQRTPVCRLCSRRFWKRRKDALALREQHTWLPPRPGTGSHMAQPSSTAQVGWLLPTPCSPAAGSGCRVQEGRCGASSSSLRLRSSCPVRPHSLCLAPDSQWARPKRRSGLHLAHALVSAPSQAGGLGGSEWMRQPRGLAFGASFMPEVPKAGGWATWSQASFLRGDPVLSPPRPTQPLAAVSKAQEGHSYTGQQLQPPSWRRQGRGPSGPPGGPALPTPGPGTPGLLSSEGTSPSVFKPPVCHSLLSEPQETLRAQSLAHTRGPWLRERSLCSQ